MLSPRNGLGLEAKNHGLSFVADSVASLFIWKKCLMFRFGHQRH